MASIPNMRITNFRKFLANRKKGHNDVSPSLLLRNMDPNQRKQKHTYQIFWRILGAAYEYLIFFF